jgi:hypothetical protein
MSLTMSESQLDNYRAGNIERMTVGVFRCIDALTGAEDDCDNDALWEAPLEDWHEPTCFACMRPACLVEVVGHEEPRG